MNWQFKVKEITRLVTIRTKTGGTRNENRKIYFLEGTVIFSYGINPNPVLEPITAINNDGLVLPLPISPIYNNQGAIMDPSQLDVPPGARNFLSGGGPGNQINGPPGLMHMPPNRLPPPLY